MASAPGAERGRNRAVGQEAVPVVGGSRRPMELPSFEAHYRELIVGSVSRAHGAQGRRLLRRQERDRPRPKAAEMRPVAASAPTDRKTLEGTWSVLIVRATVATAFAAVVTSAALLGPTSWWTGGADIALIGSTSAWLAMAVRRDLVVRAAVAASESGAAGAKHQGRAGSHEPPGHDPGGVGVD